jgi:Tfp pilus assembly protein PilF
LGELLLKQGQPAKALAAFETSLQLAANRPAQLFQCGAPAKQANDSDKARTYVAKLAEVCGFGSAADADFRNRTHVGSSLAMPLVMSFCAVV